MKSTIWNPWRGCHRHSDGCTHCYIHKGDAKRGIDTNLIIKTEKFDAPVRRKKNGEYAIPPGTLVYLCFASDFLIEDADEWRNDCWNMIRERSDLRFLFLTKRIERFQTTVPEDWGEGYDNVTVCCTVENRETAETRLTEFQRCKARHKQIVCQPLLERIDLAPWLNGIECVVAGGESDTNARPLDYDWILRLRDACAEKRVNFQFRQCGTVFIKDGTTYRLPVRLLCQQARKAGIDLEYGE